MLGELELNGFAADGANGPLKIFGLQNRSTLVALVAPCGSAALWAKPRDKPVREEGVAAFAKGLRGFLFVNVRALIKLFVKSLDKINMLARRFSFLLCADRHGRSVTVTS